MLKLAFCLFFIQQGSILSLEPPSKSVTRQENATSHASLSSRRRGSFQEWKDLTTIQTKSGQIRILTEEDADEFICRFAGYFNCQPCTCVESKYFSQGYYCDCRELGEQADCNAWSRSYLKNKNGLYNVINAENEVSVVFCDQTTDGGGWMIIQRRLDGRTNFYRSWDSYKRGFGNLSRDFWFGNERLHTTTKPVNDDLKTESSDYELWIDMKDWKERHLYARYSHFRIGDAKSNYQLFISGHTGSTSDMMTYHNGQPFSTYDADHDAFERNCAKECRGGWWYKACHMSNLNGIHYKTSQAVILGTGIHWISFKGAGYSLKSVEMKVRRKH